MCGFFGRITLADRRGLDRSVSTLAECAEQHGSDASGLIVCDGHRYEVIRGDLPMTGLVSRLGKRRGELVAGHSRLATSGVGDNQPVVVDDWAVIHKGLICNVEAVWQRRRRPRRLAIDSEVILAVVREAHDAGASLPTMADTLFTECEGTISAAVFALREGILYLFTNDRSLYIGRRRDDLFFASESWPLERVDCDTVEQVDRCLEVEIPRCRGAVGQSTVVRRHRPWLLPDVTLRDSEARLLDPAPHTLKRCTRCILPETMPFVRFDARGVCNYCAHYTIRNAGRPERELLDRVAGYRRAGRADCIVPLSGGRDSCYSLHLAVEELGMTPIAYTYDWGMVSDLARRNISRMCAALGVENIVIAADIERKRRNIRQNLRAWLRSPDLGLLSLLTAGDKHFFQHVETVKKQTGVRLSLWGINPLETTHFKAGFLGIAPDFQQERVYARGARAQLRYQAKRLRRMLRNSGYINRSLLDTLHGEYWRSMHRRTDAVHVFDYHAWSEDTVDGTLARYGWEWSPDTTTSWRIGDATAAFYNYVYHTVAGFTEHDTFRSNQIREGLITRDDALRRVLQENRPRYASIKWYLKAVGIDFVDAITAINRISRLTDQR